MNIKRSHIVPVVLVAGAFAVAGCGGGGSDSPRVALVSTLAGSGEFATADGTGAAAKFKNPVNVAVGNGGTIYAASFDDGRVCAITPAGAVTTLASGANFQRPFGITTTSAGALYVSTDVNDSGVRDSTSGTVWSVSPTTGALTVVARNLGRPRGLTALSDGRLVIVDLAFNTVRLLDPVSKAVTDIAGTSGVSGFADATGSAAKFDRPYGPAILPNGDILLADQNNNRLREVTLSGVVTTFAGTGAAGSANGQRLSATFNHPQDVAIDAAGNIYVTDNGNQLIRKIAPNGTVSTVAGGLPAGFHDGAGSIARFYGQEGLAVTPDGKTLYIADGTGGNDGLPFNRIRKIAL